VRAILESRQQRIGQRLGEGQVRRIEVGGELFLERIEQPGVVVEVGGKARRAVLPRRMQAAVAPGLALQERQRACGQPRPLRHPEVARGARQAGGVHRVPGGQALVVGARPHA